MSSAPNIESNQAPRTSRRLQGHLDPAQIDHLIHPLPAHLSALDGARIVQVSDLHVGRYMQAEQWATHIDRINALSPDLVVITGDAMDWARRWESHLLEPLEGLTPRITTLAILGNHDFYFGAERLTAGYARTPGVTLLRGQRWESDALPGLSVWGIDDPMSSLTARARYPQLRGWAERELDPRRYNLLLSHRPDAFGFASRLGFDLQLSGHTHGGQIVIAPWGRELHIAQVLGPWDRGTFREPRGLAGGPERESRLYVSRGLGFAGIPYRLDCPSEIALHELRAARPRRRDRHEA